MCFWVGNSDISTPFLRKLFPNTITMEDSFHKMGRIMRTLTPGYASNIESWSACSNAVSHTEVDTLCAFPDCFTITSFALHNNAC